MIYSNENVYIGLTEDALELSLAFNFINLNDCGGNSLFVGTTRGFEQDENQKKVDIKGLFYEAYEQMALKKMIEIVEEVMKANAEIKRCFVLHRIGFVGSGQSSILIATSSKDRNNCSNETMNILCKIKEQVPIWKKVIYLDVQSDALTDEKPANLNEEIESSSQLNTNWILKSEAFWLQKN